MHREREIDYDHISHLENSSEESKYLLNMYGVDNLTYIPGQYERLPGSEQERHSPEEYWKFTPKELVLHVYR